MVGIRVKERCELYLVIDVPSYPSSYFHSVTYLLSLHYANDKVRNYKSDTTFKRMHVVYVWLLLIYISSSIAYRGPDMRALGCTVLTLLAWPAHLILKTSPNYWTQRWKQTRLWPLLPPTPYDITPRQGDHNWILQVTPLAIPLRGEAPHSPSTASHSYRLSM